MAVFTMFCHGTNEHRSNGNDTEIIHALSAQIAGTEYKDFLILDGPGVGPGIFSTRHRRAGDFDPFTRDKEAKPWFSASWTVFGHPLSKHAYSKTGNAITDVADWAARDRAAADMRAAASGLASRASGPDVSQDLKAAARVAAQMADAAREQKASAPTWSNPGTLKTLGQAASGVMQEGIMGAAAVAVASITAPFSIGLLQSGKGKGLVYGEGMDDNIRHALAVLAKNWSDFNGHTVNMIGWSRGAVTCIRMANWIQEFFGTDINVNIFAVDPVAGGKLGEEVVDTYLIPKVVKSFVALICMDDKRGGFTPQDLRRLKIQDRQSTTCVLLPMPGAHDTPVQLGKDARYAGVAEISRYLGFKFLQLHGTTFKSGVTVYTAAQLAEKYASVKADSNVFSKLGGAGTIEAAQGGLTRRHVLDDLHQYISHSTSFFVNQHHVECFRLAYPYVYSLLCEAPPARGSREWAAPVRARRHEVDRFAESAAASSSLLFWKGLLTRQAHFWSVKHGALHRVDPGEPLQWRALLQRLVG